MTTDTLLLRHINPGFVQGEQISSQAFRPTPKDDKKLSVYDGDQITAADSYTHFLQNLDCKSYGVMAVSVQECQGLALPVVPDPETFPEHVLVDFSAESNSQIEKKGKRLRAFAETRGWVYLGGGE